MSRDDAPATWITPPAFVTDPALCSVIAALPAARFVGGCVRDTLARRDVADIDLAVPLPPDDVMRALAAAGLKSAPTGVDHGTVTAIADHRGFEVTTLRRDVQTDGRHALVAFTDDWRADAARRDFTINAMSMSPDGAVFDYFDGIADLGAGLIRFVGDPATRVAEDYLRILRFFRFFARYGKGEPDPLALAAVAGGIAGLAQLSGERIWAEIKRILVADSPDRAVDLMRQTGVWQALFADPVALECNRLSALPADPLLRFAALQPGNVAERLRLSVAERERLVALQAPALPDDADDDMLRRALADTEPNILIGRAWLENRGPQLRARIAAMPRPAFPFQGRDLIAAGLAPGPPLGIALRDLREWWLAGGCRASSDELAKELARRRGG